jgi:hypothetical protein
MPFLSFEQLLSCQLKSSCYDLVLRQPDTVGRLRKTDVSVPAVRHRALVFAAPQHFVAGNRPTECKGAVSVGALPQEHGDASKKFLPSFRGGVL